MKEKYQVPAGELEAQKDYMDKVARLDNRPGTYHIVTLGCQMNARDSETIAGMLEKMGMRAAPTREEADLVLYNTCCVRENAENKALGNVIWLKELKKDKPEMLICVGGCMTQEPGMAQRIQEKYPFVDVVFGTHNMYRLPEYIYKCLTRREPVIQVVQGDGYVVEGLPEKRNSSFQACVNIMYGCNNFCSYCIVPYVRGRERSREPEDILTEVKRLMDGGAREITLLGQNVNSYRGGGAEFAELLYRIDQLGLPRIRFMTSHPKDISDELIAAYGELKHLMPVLHLPVQSGNDEILRRMNRVYDRAHYLETVEKLRKVCPEIGLTSDIIVGFPGETEAQFEDTLSLVRQVGYDSAFTFIYSPRPGTKAAKMTDQVPADVAQARLERLLKAQEAAQAEAQKRFLGMEEEVLVESLSRRSDKAVSGKGLHGVSVTFPGTEADIGQIVRVRITECANNTLRGERIEKE